MPPKKKIIIRKKTAKVPPPSEHKRRFKLISTGKRGIVQNIVYKAPSTKNVAKALKQIDEYANIKTRQMKKTPGLSNSRVSITLLFDNGKYISTKYIDAGKKLNVNDLYTEYDADPEDFGRIKEFSVQFIPGGRIV